jgi:NAD(P)-dependent dehydrogenase (short-subunit alcohol dehydrogenase family)
MPKDITYVVTGCSGPLGAAFLERLSGHPGAHVIAVAHKTPPSCPSRHIELIRDCDLTKHGQAMRVSELLSHDSRFDSREIHLINCTGKFSGPARMADVSPPAFSETLEVNILPLFNMCRAILPIMVARGRGTIVSFTSHTTDIAFPLMGPFDAAKAAIRSLTKTIANEYGECGVTAISFALATMDTVAERKLKPRGDVKNWIKPLEVVDYVLHVMTGAHGIQNGNEIHLYKHSPTFFHQAYYQRIGHD